MDKRGQSEGELTVVVEAAVESDGAGGLEAGSPSSTEERPRVFGFGLDMIRDMIASRKGKWTAVSEALGSTESTVRAQRALEVIDLASQYISIAKDVRAEVSPEANEHLFVALSKIDPQAPEPELTTDMVRLAS